MSNKVLGRMMVHSIVAANITIPMGVANYIDTDVSGTIGTNVSKIWLITGYCSSGTVGVRTLGDTNNQDNFAPSFFLVRGSANGHLEFLRQAAADAHYNILGYLL